MSDLVKRLLDADWNSQQRFLGSRIFGEAADRISQQDAELERVRRELAEAEKKFETADKLRVFWNDKATELAGKLDDARSNVFAESALIAYAINTRGETAISLQFLIVRALRAKAEGENHG